MEWAWLNYGGSLGRGWRIFRRDVELLGFGFER